MSTQVQTMIEVSYTQRKQSTVLFRFILALPVLFFIATLEQFTHWGLGSFVITFPLVLTLVVRQVYPSWFLNFNHAIVEFSTRIAAYVLLLTDDYPTLERSEKVAVIFPDVEGGRALNRWKPIYKWILAIPHYVVGSVYLALALIATLIAWIQTAITGTYPEWAASIVLGTIKFWNRVIGYAVALVSDEYPSFNLN